jgi:hypothetical protein
MRFSAGRDDIGSAATGLFVPVVTIVFVFILLSVFILLFFLVSILILDHLFTFLFIVVVIEHPVLRAFDIVEVAALHGPEKCKPRSKPGEERDKN